MADDLVSGVSERAMDFVETHRPTEVFTELYTEWLNGTPETPNWMTSEMVSPEVNDTSAATDGWLFEPFELTAFTSIQLITAILGVVGNILVLLAIRKGKESMKPTNILVRALAVADLLTSFLILPLYPHAHSLPNNIYGELFCKLVASHIFMWTSIAASIFTLTTISIERYLAISHPFFHRRVVTQMRVRLTIVCIWILAFIININPFFVVYVDNESHKCVYMYHHRDLIGKKFYGVLVFTFEFIVPSSIMVITHALASRTLNNDLVRFKSQSSVPNACGPCENLIVAKKRNMDSFLIIFLTFVMCWLPNQIFFLLFNIGVLDRIHVEGVAYSCTVLVAFFNSCANPLIYTIRFPRFRSVIVSMLSCCTASNKEKAAGVDIFTPDMMCNHSVGPEIDNKV